MDLVAVLQTVALIAGWAVLIRSLVLRNRDQHDRADRLTTAAVVLFLIPGALWLLFP